MRFHWGSQTIFQDFNEWFSLRGFMSVWAKAIITIDTLTLFVFQCRTPNLRNWNIHFYSIFFNFYDDWQIQKYISKLEEILYKWILDNTILFKVPLYLHIIMFYVGSAASYCRFFIFFIKGIYYVVFDMIILTWET